MQPVDPGADGRHHVRSMLMRESLLDKDVMSATETPVVRMLPDCHVLKVGGRSILDGGRATTYPLVAAIREALENYKLIIGTGGGVRSRHVFSIGIDLGLPSGVLAQLAIADALGNAHMLGALLAPSGVVAIPPEIFVVGTPAQSWSCPTTSDGCRIISAGRMFRMCHLHADQRRRWAVRA
jgi:molybdenum storage protein